MPTMGYNAVEQDDHDDHDTDHDGNDHDSTGSASPAHRHPLRSLGSPVFAPPLSASLGLFLDGDQNNTSFEQNISPSTTTTGFAHMVQSVTSKSTKTSASYEMLEGDDFADDARSSPLSPAYSPVDNSISNSKSKHTASSPPSESAPIVPLHIPRARRHRNPATAGESNVSPTLSIPDPIVRTASGRRAALRHPTPDLQILQGAYTGNIQHLERTAERLSMTSSIDDAIKDLHDEQKRSDSRRSSLLSNQGMPAISRQMSNASSIVEVNSAARSGGYSPAGFMMSPKGSFTTAGGRNRSASKSSRFGQRPEPELEGRPLDSFVKLPSLPTNSPLMSRSASIAEQDEGSATLTRPIVDLLEGSQAPEDRPTTSASTNTYDQERGMFADFDGVHHYEAEHIEPEPPVHLERSLTGNAWQEPPQPQRRVSFGNDLEHPQRRTSFGNDLDNPDMAQRRMSAGNRLSMASNARPQSYADPDSGQNMVYYPAPVPMMLNLPQKLSKAPPAKIRNQRRTQVLSNIPAANRQSAIWLPDVLEDDLGDDVGIQEQEYLPQHQRVTMGGRRSTQDLANLPPQLRASAFFDLPGPEQTVEMKEQSAVATLDSILDASAHAPVSAFTDHAYAGHLGAEVYGKAAPKRHSRSSTQVLQAQESQPKKRSSSFNLLGRRRASSSDLLETDKEKKRVSTMSGGLDAGIRTVDEDEEDENKETTPLTASEGDPHSRHVSGDFGLKGEDPEEESEDEGQLDDDVYHGPPTTLLAELQLRKQQQKQRTKPLASAYPNGMHSTLLQLDAVAQVEQKSRKKGRVRLAWEDPSTQEPEDENDDEDVPLAMLYSKKAAEANRPLGLMERRDMEDNEPLSRRRDRLQGRPPGAGRASTMMNLATQQPPTDPEDPEEGETLAQRLRRLKETTIPAARPVSGDFANEMMSQFGGDAMADLKGKGKEPATVPPEEETLGQRRKRLQAEASARAKEVGQPALLNTRRSMADILQAHPSAGANRVASYEKPLGGLLGQHDKYKQQRASTMLNLSPDVGGVRGDVAPAVNSRAHSGGFKNGLFNDGQGGILPQQQPQQQGYNNMFPQPSLGNFGGMNNGLGN